MFRIAFDDNSLKEISAFAGFAMLLSPEVQAASRQISVLLIQKIQDNGLARFAQNSPDGLAHSFYETGVSPFEIEVGTDKPYGHRLDEGFHGADSLGRVYDQQGTFYATDALTEVESSGEGMGILQDAVEQACTRMGVSF
jgi:hypothetical protein